MEPTSMNKLTRSGNTFTEYKNELYEIVQERNNKRYKEFREKLKEIDRKRYNEYYVLLTIKDRVWNEEVAMHRGRIKELESEDQEKDCYREKVESVHSGKRKKLVAAVTVLAAAVSFINYRVAVTEKN